MKILYIVPYAPNQIRVRPYNLIRSLAERGNRVTILTLTANEHDRQSVRELRADGLTVHSHELPSWRSMVNALRGALTAYPLQSFYCWNADLARHALELVTDPASKFDAVHVEHLRGVRFAERLKWMQPRHKLPVVWDSVDSITYLFQQAAKQSRKLSSRIITSFELPRTRRYEGRMAALFDATLVTSPVDRQAFLEMLPPGADPDRIQILPNGVDLDYFHPDPSTQREPATLVVSGKMSYHANVSMTLHLAQNILPLVWAEKPETRLQIVGKDPPRQIQALAEDPRITITGFVPDIRPYLNKATLAVAPLTYGAGIQNKVLEAMACGTPVITTPLAARNLSAVQGSELLVEQEPADFARAVITMLDQPDRRQEVGAAGRCYVEKCHSWRAVAGQLETVYQTARASVRES